MDDPMNIGRAAQAAGVSAKMIRHYEQIGLLPAAVRSGSGYRQYSQRDVSILRFIRQARRLGFSMQQIAELLGLWSDDQRSSREVKALAMAHLEALEQKLREMAEMKAALERLVSICHGDEHPDCAILTELAVDSAAAPAPGSIGPGASGKAPRRTRESGGQAAAPAAASHADLMAWALAASRRSAKR